MGDFKKPKKATTNSALESAAAEREKRGKGQDGTVKKIAGGKSEQKTKAISGKVFPELWAEFTKINRAQGMSNNSALNMIISKYVRENKDILDE